MKTAIKLSWYKRFIKRHFSNSKRVRRYIGGYWEKWYIDVIHCDLWFYITKEQAYGYYRPGCGYGTPYCEYYPIEFFDYKTNFSSINLERKMKFKKILDAN